MSSAPDRFNAAAWLVDRHVAAGRGDAVAFVCGEERQTYAQLQAAVWAAGRGFRGLGIEPGDRIILVLSDELTFPAAFLGALHIGAVPIPVSTMLRAEDVADLAADSEAKVAVVSSRYAPYLPTITEAAPSVRTTVVSGPGGERASLRWGDFDDGRELAPVATAKDSEGFWLYTSGTTGQPKGAVHAHGDIEAIYRTYARSVLRIGPDDRCYSIPKLFFAFGLGNALVFPLAAGATAVIDPAPPTPALAAELLLAHRPTLWFAPPGFCAAMVDAGVPADALASVRAVVTAGETLPAEIQRRFTGRFGVEMLDGIGSTEALHIFISNHPGRARPGTTGEPVAGYQARLLDEAGAEIVDDDVPGALWVRGESMASGYWRRPEITAATFVDGWVRTGDVYSRSADGYYRFVGRNSDMIKAGGIWVSPAEVESVLLEHDDVLEAAVIGGRNAVGLETTVAFVVARRGHRIDVVALGAHCRARMAAFKRPGVIHVTDELPKTATGKIRRFALRESWAAGGVG